MTEKASHDDVVRIDGAGEGGYEEATELAELCNKHERLRLPLVLGGPAEGFGYYAGDALVGYFELHPAGGPEMEGSGMVHPGHRRGGIGRALIEAVRADCRERGRTGFLFACDEAGSASRPFASAIGADYRMSEHLLELDVDRRPASPGGPLSIREATLDDVDDVVRIGMRGFGEGEDQTEFRRRRTRGWLEEPLRVVYVAEFEGRAVGTATLYLVPDSSDGFINGLAVLPQYQGRGFGRQILSDAVDGLISRGRESVKIEVQTDNEGALGLYESAGFEKSVTYAYYRVDAGEV
ncbi:MAG: GNAT family N-acetyltransferase [Chloroflexi bacterium]|nr:GNAT family N-acetyltransferase [Chloroflexota bacterium]